MSDDQPRCANCDWSEFDPAETKGLCRINPPLTFQGSRAIVACWPRVAPNDWCGAHPAFNTVIAVES